MTSQNGSSQKPVVLVIDEDRDFLDGLRHAAHSGRV